MAALRYSRCPLKFLILILLSILSGFVSSVAASFGQAFANVTFSPPYLEQLKENTNRTVWIRVTVQRQSIDGKYALESENFGNNSTDKTLRPFASSTFKESPPPSLVFEYEVQDKSIARITAPPSSVYHRQRVEKFDRALSANNSNMESDDDGEDDKDERYWIFKTSFTMKGLFLGKTKLDIKMYALTGDNGSQSEKLENRSNFAQKTGYETGDRGRNSVAYEYSYSISVVRADKKLSHIFVGLLMILLIMANVLMGAQLNLNVVWEVIKKPFAPAIGFFCQFVVMPVISYCLAQIFFVPVGLYNLALGLFTTGCCPGGGASNAYTCLLDGNVDLSITMTFLSTLLSMATMPLWMFALGRQFLVDHPGRKITVPYTNICYSLLMLVIPLCAGALIRRFIPKVADHMKKVLRPFLGLIIVFICTFGVYVNLYMFRLMNWRVLVSGLALPWLGFKFGLIIAALARQPKPNIVAISVETGIQNTGIAIMLLQLSFVQPDADMAAVLPVVVAMFTPVPMIVVMAIHYVKKWRTEKKKKEQNQKYPEQLAALT